MSMQFRGSEGTTKDLNGPFVELLEDEPNILCFPLLFVGHWKAIFTTGLFRKHVIYAMLEVYIRQI